MLTFKYTIFLICFSQIFAQDYGGFLFENFKLSFLPSTSMGLLLALALPLEKPYSNVYVAYNFETSYALPANDSFLEYPPIVGRSIDRKFVYNAIQTKMESTGYPGKPCLLRMICELASTDSILHVNGVLGDIMHVILSPSTSTNENLDKDYEEAEKTGKKQKKCDKYKKKCSTSFIDLITWMEKAENLV